MTEKADLDAIFRKFDIQEKIMKETIELIRIQQNQITDLQERYEKLRCKFIEFVEIQKEKSQSDSYHFQDLYNKVIMMVEGMARSNNLNN